MREKLILNEKPQRSNIPVIKQNSVIKLIKKAFLTKNLKLV